MAGLFPLQAQTDDELFGSSESLVTEAPLVKPVESSASDISTGLLKTETVKIGGAFTFSLAGTAAGDSTIFSDYPTPSVVSYADLYADARPADNFRFFIKGRFSYPYTSDSSGNNPFSLREAYADIEPLSGINARLGKQTANWGVGYFFSPGNLLDFGTIDPENPTEERTGPLAVKFQRSQRTSNYYLYLLLDSAYSGGPIGLAPKAEWVLGSSELSLGAYWQNDKPWAVTGSITFPMGPLDMFVEGAVKGNIDKNFLVLNGPALTAETRQDKIFGQGTIGFSWSMDDSEGRYSLSLRGQYYYNGLGYENSDLFIAYPMQVASLLQQKTITVQDLKERGQHYGAGSLGISKILSSDFGLSFFWLGNLSDSSGKTSATLSWSGLDKLNCSIAYSYAYGQEGTEFRPVGSVASSITLKVSLSMATF
ncbi:hypothetical protein ER57_05310 [Smithella sp. SCADC]|jgi:hypothetical protein|nr:hypothetical protein ER57_05310 [Smithella sp. SCADC]